MHLDNSTSPLEPRLKQRLNNTTIQAKAGRVNEKRRKLRRNHKTGSGRGHGQIRGCHVHTGTGNRISQTVASATLCSFRTLLDLWNTESRTTLWMVHLHPWRFQPPLPPAQPLTTNPWQWTRQTETTTRPASHRRRCSSSRRIKTAPVMTYLAFPAPRQKDSTNNCNKPYQEATALT